MSGEQENKLGKMLQFRRSGDLKWGIALSSEEMQDKDLLQALIQRGSNAKEASEITGVPIKEIASKAQLESQAIQDQAVEEDDPRSIEFVRVLHSEGFIGTDLFGWHLLFKLYMLERRKLPDSIAERIRLEAFFLAKLSQRAGDQRPIIKYNTLGLELGGSWFETSLADEEDFISNSIMSASGGSSEDRHGFYREDEDGNRWREPIGSGENGIICDSTEMVLQRRMLREAGQFQDRD